MPSTTVIFTHGDCDGMCSGALALAANEGAAIHFTNPVAILDDLGQAEGADRVIVCDIAINPHFAPALVKKIDLLAKKAEVIYIDHHPRPPELSGSWLVHDVHACASELTYMHFRGSLDPDMSRVALYGAIGDYMDHTPLARELSATWDRRSLYYEAGTLAQGIEIGRRDYEYKRDLVKLLADNALPSGIETLARNAVRASRLEEELRRRIERDVVRLNNVSYVIDQEGFISKGAIYAHIYGGTCVGVAAEYLETKDVYDVSARAKCDLDLNRLVGEAAKKNGGTGGGHPHAAGGRIPAASIMDFLKDLDGSITAGQK